MTSTAVTLNPLRIAFMAYLRGLKATARVGFVGRGDSGSMYEWSIVNDVKILHDQDARTPPPSYIEMDGGRTVSVHSALESLCDSAIEAADVGGYCDNEGGEVDIVIDPMLSEDTPNGEIRVTARFITLSEGETTKV